MKRKRRVLNERGFMVLGGLLMILFLVLIIIGANNEKEEYTFFKKCIDDNGNTYNYCYGEWLKNNS